MDTSRLTKRAAEATEDLKAVTSMLRDKSAELMKRSSSELADRSPVVMRSSRRPAWRSGALWFAGGMAMAAAITYFFDRQRGNARRHMAYDRLMATGRDMTRWSGGKARHLRNRAMGTMAEMQGPEDRVETQGSSRY
jgi:hypothetical protein